VRTLCTCCNDAFLCEMHLDHPNMEGECYALIWKVHVCKAIFVKSICSHKELNKFEII